MDVTREVRLKKKKTKTTRQSVSFPNMGDIVEKCKHKEAAT